MEIHKHMHVHEYVIGISILAFVKNVFLILLFGRKTKKSTLI